MGRNRLKLMLITGDAAAIALGYAFALWRSDYYVFEGLLATAGLVVAAVVIGLASVRSQGLFLARVSAVRSVELTRSTRAVSLLAAGMIVLDRVVKANFRIRDILIGAAISWILIVLNRSVFRAWVAVQRSNGRHQRRVLVVGCDAEAARLIALFATHADLGMRVVGIVGDRTEAVRHHLDGVWLGDVDDTEMLVAAHDASGVVVSPTALDSSRLNNLIRNLQHADVHVHLATGISGIDARRLRSLPISHEPMLYVEAPALSRVQIVVKRGFDMVVAALLLLLASPVLLLIALAIKLQDGGPVYFRQERVGRRGVGFDVLKFRTMGVDAEAQLAALKAANERNGPLFKMEHDPRVTRVGRLLRETSLDELPQLVNVLRGEMSLVGPRPALPSEVANFGADLRQREQVPPGITGLWQVEARDSPSFEAYRRLDLFYVENWSITLDLLIMVGTVEHLVVRLVTSLRRRSRTPAVAEPLADAGGIAEHAA
jgi:exopolysaccharide biosynthesis polyprenyl glycosylphosphotransferase